MSSNTSRNASTSSSSGHSLKGAMHWVAKRVKQHDQANKAAWEAYYGIVPLPQEMSTSRKTNKVADVSAKEVTVKEPKPRSSFEGFMPLPYETHAAYRARLSANGERQYW